MIHGRKDGAVSIKIESISSSSCQCPSFAVAFQLLRYHFLLNLNSWAQAKSQNPNPLCSMQLPSLPDMVLLTVPTT